MPDYGLIYRGEALPEDLTIAGAVRVTLHVQSSCPDTDFIAKLVDLHPDGRAKLLMDGVMRAMYRGSSAVPHHLASGQVASLTIELGHIHHTFPPATGSRSTSPAAIFRAGPAHQQRQPVLANDTDGDIRVAANTVHHAETRPPLSSFSLEPVTRRTPSAVVRLARAVGVVVAAARHGSGRRAGHLRRPRPRP